MATLTYGIKDRKLHHVDEVEQGLKCECICPNCKEKLIARQGDINEHHFAHVAKECDITIAQEAAVRYMAKEILDEQKQIKLPQVIFTSNNAFLGNKEYQQTDKRIDKSQLIKRYEGEDAKTLRFDVVTEDKKYVICDELRIALSIKQRHAEHKWDEYTLKTDSYRVLEIDLTQYKDQVDSLFGTKLKEILTEGLIHKHWVYDPQYEYHIHTITGNNRRYIAKETEAINNCCDMFKPENYITGQNNITDNQHARNFWRKQKISQKIREIPWYVGQHIYGDFIFEVDRRVWQGFVINAIANSKYPTTPGSLWKYVKTKEFLRIRQEFLEPMWVSDKMKMSGYDVIKQYHEFLYNNRIIDEGGLLCV